MTHEEHGDCENPDRQNVAKYEIFCSRFSQRPEKHWDFEKDEIGTVRQVPPSQVFPTTGNTPQG